MANTYDIRVKTNTYVPELGHEYADAQYFTIPEGVTIDEFKAQNEAAIQAEEASRIQARINEKQNPTPPKEYSKEELISIKAELLAQAEAQITELDEKIAVAKDAKDIVADVVAEEIIP